MRRKSEEKPKPAESVKVPIDTVSEAVLIASVVRDESARSKYLNSLPTDFFFGDGHAAMWLALREQYRQGLEYSPETVATFCHGRFKPEVLDEYVRAYREASANVRRHVEVVRWNKQKRDAAEGSVAEFLEVFRDPASTAERVREAAHRISHSFEGAGDLRYLRNSMLIVEEHAVELRQRREGRALYPYGLPGFDRYGEQDFEEKMVDGKPLRVSLDQRARMIPGASPGDITVVTGESGSGKTTAMVHIVASMIRQGRRVLWGAWEQRNGPSLEALACMNLGISKRSMRTGDFSAEDEFDVLKEMGRVGEMIRFFDLPFGRETDEKRKYNRENLNLIHQYVAESKCDVFVADLFSDALEEGGADDEAQALKRMKAISLECGVHTFLVHWLRHKGLAEREDKRPTRDLVLGSGAWIGKSDTVIAFHRPGLHGAPADDRLECHVLKQRHGPWPLAVEFDWDGEYGSIENGRTLNVAPAGQKTGIDEFLGDAAPAKPDKKRRR